MNRSIWLSRGAAIVCIVCAVLSVRAVASVASDIWAVNQARSGADGPPAPSVRLAEGPPPKPVIRAGGSGLQAAVTEYLNTELGALDVAPSATDVTSVRPLGGGVSLVEINLAADADSQGAAAFAQWVAVNRDAVRMKSLGVSQSGEGRPTINATLLLVTAP